MVIARRNVNATEGPIFSKIIVFAIPLMLTNVIQQLYSMADSIVVGQFSGDPNALAAIGSTTTLIALFTALMTGFSAGTSVVVARSFGAKDRDTLSDGVHTSALFGLLVGLILAATAFLVSAPMLTLLDTKEELYDKALTYVRVICIGMPAQAVYNFGAATLRSVGDSKTPFYALTSSGIGNVLLNLVFVIVFRLSLVGVAIATVVSHYLSAAIVIVTLVKRKGEPYALEFKKLALHKKTALTIFRLGAPAAIQGSLFGITNLFLIAALNQFPTPVVSARTIATNIDVILSTAINTYLHVTMTFAGQNFGAKKPDRIKKTLFYSLAQVIFIGVVVGQIMLFFYEPLVNMYLAADDPNREEVLKAAKEIMTVMLSSYFIGAIDEALSGFLRGLGETLLPMIASIGGICAFRLLWINLIYPYLGTLTWMYMVYPISWTITGLGLAFMSVIAWKKRVRPMMAELQKTEK